MTAIFDAGSKGGYNATVKETKTDRINAMLKPSVKKMLEECATVFRLSEADAVAEAIIYLRASKKYREALAKPTDTGEGG